MAMSVDKFAFKVMIFNLLSYPYIPGHLRLVQQMICLATSLISNVLKSVIKEVVFYIKNKLGLDDH